MHAVATCICPFSTLSDVSSAVVCVFCGVLCVPEATTPKQQPTPEAKTLKQKPEATKNSLLSGLSAVTARLGFP